MIGCFRLLVCVLAVVIAPSLVFPAANAQAREPISPGDDEVAAHLVGTMPVIRMDFARFPALQAVGAIPVELLVDEHGAVTSAKLEGEDDDAGELTKAQLDLVKALIAEAEKTAMKLHFRPF